MNEKRPKSVWLYLQQKQKIDGAGCFVLMDPDKETPDELAVRAHHCEDAGIDAILLGASSVKAGRFREASQAVHEAVSLPIILFPGGAAQVTPHADAILFLSLISGRNPDFLIGQQVLGAPLVKKYHLESIPTGYVLVESGRSTSVQQASRTKPLARTNTARAVAYGLTAQYFGMKAVYLEAGSGAKNSVPSCMITSVSKETDIAVIVGGGIRTPAQAAAKVRAGADYIVTGTVFETQGKYNLLKKMRNAVKSAGKKRNRL